MREPHLYLVVKKPNIQSSFNVEMALLRIVLKPNNKWPALEHLAAQDSKPINTIKHCN